MLPSEFELENVELDLDEIQSLDLEEIITDKVKRAFELVGKAVVVEDVSAGLDKLHGLPGPFMKFFEKQIGVDALFQLADVTGDPATVRCAMAYYDGISLITAQGDIHGTVVPARGKKGFGFDFCFIVDGATKTFAEMTPAEKDAVSHRAKALKQLLSKLRSAS